MSEFIAANKIAVARTRQRVWDCLAHLMSYILSYRRRRYPRMHGPADFLIDDESRVLERSARVGPSSLHLPLRQPLPMALLLHVHSYR